MKLREDCFISAANLADALIENEQFAEAKSILREQIPMADETNEHYINLYRNAAAFLRRKLAKALLLDGVPSLDDLNEAVALLEEVDRTCEDLFDKSHGDAQVVKAELKKARAKLARARKAVARRAAATAADRDA